MDWADLFKQLGFPVVVALWLMLRIERRINRLVKLQASLIRTMRLVAVAVDDDTHISRKTKTRLLLREAERELGEDEDSDVEELSDLDLKEEP